MSLIRTIDETQYPESDGKPMGETDVHIDWMIRIRDILKYRYREQRVYVASNLLVYYQQGEPHKFVVPDDFVVLDCDPGRRRTFKTWEEGKSPDVVFEVTSRSSRKDDQSYKPQVYSQLKVGEYFLYDPTSEYLNPPLQGLRLEGSSYIPIQPDETGALACTLLDIGMRLIDGELLFFDLQNGEPLPTKAEAFQAALQQAELDRQRAEEAFQLAKQDRDNSDRRAAELQAEVERLQAELKSKGRDA